MIASVSKVKMFKSCRQAYRFRYLEHLRPVQRPEALEVGTNYHNLVESLYKDGFLPDEDSFSKELAMANAYEKYIYPAVRVQEVEEWLEKPVGRHTLVGRVDGIAEDGSVVEHKTTSGEITEEYEYNLLWDDQILAYMYLTGSRTVYYTVIRKPTIRQKKGETEEDFFLRMIAWYDTDTESKIRLLKISRTDEEVEQFAIEFETVCDEMELGTIYKNQSHCTRWGRQCEYASICLYYDPDKTYIEFIKEEYNNETAKG